MFYRIDDVSDLDGPFFFERAMLLFSYQGALRCRLESEMTIQRAEEEAWKGRFGSKGQPTRTTLGSGNSVRVNGPQDVSAPEFNGLIEFA